MIEWVSVEGVIADLSAKLGVDLGGVDLDQPLAELPYLACRGSSTPCVTAAGNRRPFATCRDVCSGRLVGAPEQIADQLGVLARAGIDGVNIMDVSGHGAFEDFAAHMAPCCTGGGSCSANTPPEPAGEAVRTGLPVA